ncbi:MAG: hypothetical protein WEC15_06855 [Flavobacteriales bacterium]
MDAQLHMHQRGMVILRFKGAVRSDQCMMHGTTNARVAPCSGRGLPELCIIPCGQDFQIEVPITDNSLSLVQHTLAEAVVARGYSFTFAELHYRNVPQPFPAGVFRMEEEAGEYSLA